MKQWLGILLFISFYQGYLSAQYIPMVEEGKYWIYLNYTNADRPKPNQAYVLYFKDDVLIDGKNFKNVYWDALAGTNSCPPEERPCFTPSIPYRQMHHPNKIGYIRENLSSRQVFYRPEGTGGCAENEQLIFDFSLRVGDPLDTCAQMALGDGPTFGFIDSLKQEFYEDQNRIIQYTTGYTSYLGLPPLGVVRIIEGIGYENFGPLHKSLNLNELIDFCQEGFDDCNLITSTKFNQLNKKEPPIVYPNPFSNHLSIIPNDEVKNISVFDLNGRQILSSSENSPKRYQNLLEGVYLLRIVYGDHTSFTIKVLKKK